MLTDNEWIRIKEALENPPEESGSIMKVIFRSAAGISEMEKQWILALQGMGHEVRSVEQLWSASSPTGVLIIRLAAGPSILALWIICDETELVKIEYIENEDEVDAFLDSLSSSNIMSGVMRLFTYESIPYQNL